MAVTGTVSVNRIENAPLKGMKLFQKENLDSCDSYYTDRPTSWLFDKKQQSCQFLVYICRQGANTISQTVLSLLKEEGRHRTTKHQTGIQPINGRCRQF